MRNGCGIANDLILLDQHLPDLAGAEVLNRLKGDPALRATPSSS